MEDMTIRLLRAEEIECRIAMVNEKGVSLLLFKDARVDQKLLDETFTPFGWKQSHQVIDGNLYCTVEVWDKEKEQWIGKQDVGTMPKRKKTRHPTALNGPALIGASAGNYIPPRLSGFQQGGQ